MGAPDDGRHVPSAVVGRARSAYACQALTPPGTRAPSRVIGRHPPARGRYTRARWMSLPIVRLHRVPSVGVIERLCGRASVGGTPLPNISKPPLPRKFPLFPAPLPQGNPAAQMKMLDARPCQESDLRREAKRLRGSLPTEGHATAKDGNATCKRRSACSGGAARYSSLCRE